MLSRMAQVIVRKLEKSVVLKLKRRAAFEGMSMEEKLRRVLRSLAEEKIPRRKPALNFKELLVKVPYFGNDFDKERKKWKMRDIDFD